MISLSCICMILSIAFFFTPGMGTIDLYIEIFVIALAILFAGLSIEECNSVFLMISGGEKSYSKWNIVGIILHRYIGMATVVFCIYPDITREHTIPDFFVKNGGLLFKIWCISIVLRWILPVLINGISSIKSRKAGGNINYSNSSSSGSGSSAGYYRSESYSYNHPISSSNNNYSYSNKRSSRKERKESKWDRDMKKVIKETERKMIIRKLMGLD